MKALLALLGAVFPLEDIILGLDLVRETQGSWKWSAAACVTSP